MRKLYLEYDGTRISLNGDNGYLLHQIAGFGVTFNSSYSEIGNGFFRKTDIRQAQGDITGTLTIFGTAYESYETFVDKILTASKLVLVYNPCGTEYKADCELNFITKGEAVGDAFISVPISFRLKSLWYTEATQTGTGTVSVSAGGQVGSAVKVTATGMSLTNPKITLTANGTAVVDVRITGSVASNKVLEYCNYYDDSHLLIGTEDAIPKTDLSRTIYAQIRGAYTVKVTDASNHNPSITVVVRKYWRSV